MSDEMKFEDEEVEVLVEGVDEIPKELTDPPPEPPPEPPKSEVKMDALLQGLQKLVEVKPQETPPPQPPPKPEFDKEGKYNETFLEDPKNHLDQWGKEYLIPQIASAVSQMIPDITPLVKRQVEENEGFKTTLELYRGEVEAEFNKIPEVQRRRDTGSYARAVEAVRNRHFGDLVAYEASRRQEVEKTPPPPTPYYETYGKPAPKKKQVILSAGERAEADIKGMPYDQYWRIKYGRK